MLSQYNSSKTPYEFNDLGCIKIFIFIKNNKQYQNTDRLIIIMNYTTDQVLALAPDAASIKAAKKLTSASKWSLMEYSHGAVWGHCRGSGSNPYEVGIDLNGPAFKCSCPSRKIPCKHVLALLLMHADGILTKASIPDWITEWLEKREQREQARITRAEKKATQRKSDPQAQAKKRAKRVKTMQDGLLDCEKWLLDIVAHGFSSLQSQGYSMWDTAAARLVDAKAPGAAEMVHHMGSVAAGGSANWLDELTLLTGRLFALIRTFYRYDQLSLEQQADLRTAMGWPMEKDEVISHGKTRTGTWVVMGESIRDNGNIREQRIWLHEQTTHTMALILNFQYGNQPFDLFMVPGTVFEGEIAFYPGSWPMRALVKKSVGNMEKALNVQGATTIEQALSSIAEAVALNPWITLFPMVLSNCIPQLKDDSLHLWDCKGRSIKINSKFKENWEMLALSGSKGITVVGEWEQQTLLPLSCWSNDGFYRFKTDV